MSAMSGRQVDALYGIRMSVPMGTGDLEVSPADRSGWRVVTPQGRCWLIDQFGDVRPERVAA